MTSNSVLSTREHSRLGWNGPDTCRNAWWWLVWMLMWIKTEIDWKSSSEAQRLHQYGKECNKHERLERFYLVGRLLRIQKRYGMTDFALQIFQLLMIKGVGQPFKSDLQKLWTKKKLWLLVSLLLWDKLEQDKPQINWFVSPLNILFIWTKWFLLLRTTTPCLVCLDRQKKSGRGWGKYFSD